MESYPNGIVSVWNYRNGLSSLWTDGSLEIHWLTIIVIVWMVAVDYWIEIGWFVHRDCSGDGQWCIVRCNCRNWLIILFDALIACGMIRCDCCDWEIRWWWDVVIIVIDRLHCLCGMIRDKIIVVHYRRCENRYMIVAYQRDPGIMCCNRGDSLPTIVRIQLDITGWMKACVC